jgi:hypothetical protein
MILFESLRVSKSVEICMFLVSGWTLLHWCWPLVISTGVHQLSTQGVSSGVFTSWVGVFSGEYWRIYFDVLKGAVGDIWCRCWLLKCFHHFTFVCIIQQFLILLV